MIRLILAGAISVGRGIVVLPSIPVAGRVSTLDAAVHA